jgi:hypothetical protein
MRYAGLTDPSTTLRTSSLRMTRNKENGNAAIPATSELCSNSLARRLPVNGKGECWPKGMRKIAAVKAGNMAIPFQSEVSSQLFAAGQ